MYYRLTNWQDKLTDCWYWWHHMLNANIPAAIVEQDGQFAVYRDPTGVILDKNAKLEPINGRIRCEWRWSCVA